MLHLSALKSSIKKVGHVATCMQITGNKTRHVEAAKANFEGGMGDRRRLSPNTQTPISETDYSLLFRQWQQQQQHRGEKEETVAILTSYDWH